jgi:outer membrane protein assembly factor BamB
MKNMTLLLSSILFLMAGCHKEDPSPDPPVVVKPVFEYLWKTRIYEAPMERVGSNYVYFHNKQYFFPGDLWQPDPSLFAFDGKSGKLNWKWKQSGRFQYPANRIAGKNEIIVGSSAKGIYAFDLLAQDLLWEDINEDYGEVGGNVLLVKDHYVYTSTHKQNFYGPVSIHRFDINTGKKETLVTVPIEGKWSPSVSPPAFWKNAQGDDIMIFINGKSNVDASPQESPTDLWAYNLTQKSLMWKIENVMEVPTGLLTPPVIYNNTVLFGGDWSIYSVDIPSGTVKWRTQFPELGKFGSFNKTGLLLKGDKLYGNPGVFDIFCLNANDGSVVWHNKKDAPNCTPTMLYVDDMLVFTSWGFGSVVIIDALTGRLIHREQSPNIFTTDVVYDEESDTYFVQDFAHAVGFKINKPK